MHFDYKSDAPLDGVYTRLMDKKLLLVHRDIFMGNAAARLAVLTDSTADYGGDGKKRALTLWRECVRHKKHGRETAYFAAEYYSHCVFFQSLYSEDGESYPSESAAARLERDFGSVESFCYAFRKKAEECPVGGFLWLCAAPAIPPLTKKHREHGALRLVYTSPGILPDETMIQYAALDLWEHAYIGAFAGSVGAYAAHYLAALDWNKVFG